MIITQVCLRLATIKDNSKMCSFTVLGGYKTSTSVDISQQHSSNDFMNYFTSKINTIRDKTVIMQLPAAVSHQIVHNRSPEE